MHYERLKTLRKEAKMTQVNLAKALSMHTTTYTRYESGLRDLPMEVAIRLPTTIMSAWTIWSAAARSGNCASSEFSTFAGGIVENCRPAARTCQPRNGLVNRAKICYTPTEQ